MPTITLDGISLPGDFVWEDEFQWRSVALESNYSLTGAMIHQTGVKLSGRPITLSASNEFLGPIWITRSVVDALYGKTALVNHTMVLTLSDGRSFNVMFAEKGIEAKAVYHIAPHQNNDPYYITIYLLTV